MGTQVERIGLTELHSPSDGAAAVDVIFVHGLFGHPYYTWAFKQEAPQAALPVPSVAVKLGRIAWPPRMGLFRRTGPKTQQPPNTQISPPAERQTYEEGSHMSQEHLGTPPSGAQDVFWPRDLLPSVLPQANIYTWGYDVDINNMFSPASQSSVLHHAGTLLSDLADLRISKVEKSRPMIFVAHSLGGIVVKDALSLSKAEKTYLNEILPATIGVCFLGTPHRGSSTATLGKVAFEISKVFFQKPAISVLRSLEVNSETLERVSRSFSQILADRKIKIHSFREELPTVGVMVVDTFSYSIGDGLENTGSIHSNHSNMTKYPSAQDMGFRRVSTVLKRWVEDSKNLSIHATLDPPTATDSYLPEGRSVTPEEPERGFSDTQLCLDSLNVSEARSRIDMVEKTFGETYSWIFTNQVNFKDWLRQRKGSGVYWIQGKPGAGKSTLMKFALGHQTTSGLLRSCHPLPWILAGFFFHDRGSGIQKSVQGLLCEMLYQTLRRKRELIGLVLPTYHNKIKFKDKGRPGDMPETPWHTEDLREALMSIANQDRIRFNVCYFIDALDEHLGDHWELLQILDDFVTAAKSNTLQVKLCVASRPENIFKDRLSKYPGFAIHEHTMTDVLQYTSGRMEPELAQDMPVKKRIELHNLSKEVVERAQGVFLWVKLVVDELLECLREGDSIAELRHLLSTIPSELKDLYRRAISRVKNRRVSAETKVRWAHEAFVMFQVALCCRTPYPLATFMNVTSLLVSGTVEQSQLDWMRRPIPTDDMRRRLVGRCGGLLETVTGEQYNRTGLSDVVQFIHQTTKEYFQRGGAGDILSEGVGDIPKESGHVLLVQYCVDVVCRGLDIRIPDFLFHALNAEKTTRRSHTRDIDRLIDATPDNAFQNLTNLFTELDIPKPLAGGFAKLRERADQPSIWLLFMAVYGSLIRYLEEKLPPEMQLSREHDGQLIAAAIGVASYTEALSKEQVGDLAVLKFLLRRKLTANCTCAGKFAFCYAFEKGNEGERQLLLDLLAELLIVKNNSLGGRTAAATIEKPKYLDASKLLMESCTTNRLAFGTMRTLASGNTLSKSTVVDMAHKYMDHKFPTLKSFLTAALPTYEERLYRRES